MKERETHYLKDGYDKIIGIRDMYCEAYDKHAKRRMNNGVTARFEKEAIKQIRQMSNPEKIAIYFSIMEFEAWILGMYNLFSKMNKKMTVEFIEKEHGFNLKNIDPQKEFYRPSLQLASICKSCVFKYDKSSNSLESLVSLMDKSDLDTIIEGNRCISFDSLYKCLTSFGTM
jgi:hypothetical protein